MIDKPSVDAFDIEIVTVMPDENVSFIEELVHVLHQSIVVLLVPLVEREVRQGFAVNLFFAFPHVRNGVDEGILVYVKDVILFMPIEKPPTVGRIFYIEEESSSFRTFDVAPSWCWGSRSATRFSLRHCRAEIHSLL